MSTKQEIKENEVIVDKEEWCYLAFYNFIVSSGIVSKLTHPIEWAVNAYRTPGATFSKEYYIKCNKYLPRFLCEICSDYHCARPENADEVLQWCDAHYKQNSIIRNPFDLSRIGIFNDLKSGIEEEIIRLNKLYEKKP